MPELPFPAEVRALLTQANPAVVTTLRSDGHPVSVATWYLLEDDDRVLVNMDHTRVRVQHLRRDPRVTLTALDEAGWYTHVSLIGTVTEMARRRGPGRHRPAQHPLPQPPVPEPDQPAGERLDHRREVARLGRRQGLTSVGGR